MTIHEILSDIREDARTTADKGTKFEALILNYFLTEPNFANQLDHAWLWGDFPYRKEFGGHDVGVDVVCHTKTDEYWAIQCKCYDENAYIDKKEIDSFIAASGKTFCDETGAKIKFAVRYWVSISNNWSATAEEEIQNFYIVLTISH